MKQSKQSKIDYAMGVIFLIGCFILFIIYDDKTFILLGFALNNFLWLLGILEELYKKEEKK